MPLQAFDRFGSDTLFISIFAKAIGLEYGVDQGANIIHTSFIGVAGDTFSTGIEYAANILSALTPAREGRPFSPAVARFVSEHEALEFLSRASLFPLMLFSRILVNFGGSPTFLCIMNDFALEKRSSWDIKTILYAYS